jgi:hypothetical protein
MIRRSECFRLIVEMLCVKEKRDERCDVSAAQLCISLGAHENGNKNVAECKLLLSYSLSRARVCVMLCYDVWERIFLNQITPE